METVRETNLDNLDTRIALWVKAKGWWDNDDLLSDKLLLVHSEISEAIEEIRNGHAPTEIYFNDSNPNKPEGFPIEIADAVIRIIDLCGHLGIDLPQAITMKMNYNDTRPYRHGGKVI